MKTPGNYLVIAIADTTTSSFYQNHFPQQQLTTIFVASEGRIEHGFRALVAACKFVESHLVTVEL